MRPALTRILLFLLFFSSSVAATNFTACLIDYKNDPHAFGGVDSHGHLVADSAQAVGFTYETCTSRCGTESESFNWRNFAQLFSSWLLPWLALISQLPFGSGDPVDDFISVTMSVGSPALASYSLVLTSLNSRSVYGRAKRCKHESRLIVARALVSLQQTPLELTTNKRLLRFIPVNDHWRNEIADRLNRRNAWSVAAATSVAWVVIAFLFTLIDSFVSLDGTGDEPSEGQAVGTLWLWLLCLVVGWMWVPTFTSGELRRAIHHANHRAVKKVAKRLKEKAKEKANKAISSTRKATIKISKRVPILKGSKKTGAEHAFDGTNEKAEGSIQEDIKVGEGVDTHPDLPSTPTHEVEEDHDHLGVTNYAANQSVHTLPHSIAGHSVAQSSIHPEKHSLFTYKDLGSLNKDERRGAATFNYARVMRYLVLVDDVLRALDKLTLKGEEDEPTPDATVPVENPTFPTGALTSMFNASVAALTLQCGITAAAAGIVIFTPTIGLGCRSLAYIIYGGLSIVIMYLSMISTILARISETRKESSAFVKSLTKFFAIAIRRICLLLALLNMTGIILISCLQFSNFLDNCYCNASVTGDGTDSYIIISYFGWLNTMRTARIIATAVAGGSMFVFMVFLWLMSALPAHDEVV